MAEAHTGENMAEEVYKVVQQFGLEDRVSHEISKLASQTNLLD